MNTPIKRKAIEVAAASIVVVVAAFLPWGEVDFRRMVVPGEQGGGMGEAFHQMMTAFGVVPVTLWNGHADLGGMKLPNVLVLFAAITASVLAWLRAMSFRRVPTKAALAFAGYGLAHSSFVLVNLALSAEGSVRIGVVMTALAFIWMVIALWRQSTESEPGESLTIPNEAA